MEIRSAKIRHLKVTEINFQICHAVHAGSRQMKLESWRINVLQGRECFDLRAAHFFVWCLTVRHLVP
jgi:hypothetical protein